MARDSGREERGADACDRQARDENRPPAVVQIDPALKNPFISQYGEPEWDVKKAYPDEGGSTMDRLLRHGHDGIIIPFSRDTWAIVFDPAQVRYVSHEQRGAGAKAAALGVLTFKHLPHHLAGDDGPEPTDRDIDTLAAYEDSRVVGWISWMTSGSWTKGAVDALYVDPSHRRQGLATDLLA